MIRRLLPVASCFLFTAGAAVHAGPRASASYSVSAESIDAGGHGAGSAIYSNEGSMGGMTGWHSAPPQGPVVASGYLPQIPNPGLFLSAGENEVAETAPFQLAATFVLDDGTESAVPAGGVQWAVTGGPITGISAAGLAVAGVVPQSSVAGVQGTYDGQTGVLAITVLNTLVDNFGTYAGDGIADDWQMRYFGTGNPLAGPESDPDGDGQNNRFEFTAGVAPDTRLSRFLLLVEPVPGPPRQMQVIFSPVVFGRSYTVEYSTLTDPGNWSPLAVFSQQDNGEERTITDRSAAPGPRRFYRVRVANP